jgi:hypothetical protein
MQTDSYVLLLTLPSSADGTFSEVGEKALRGRKMVSPILATHIASFLM